MYIDYNQYINKSLRSKAVIIAPLLITDLILIPLKLLIKIENNWDFSFK